MALLDVNIRRDAFYAAIVLPSCVLMAYLCCSWTIAYVAVLPLLVFAGSAVAESLQEFLQGKQAMRRSQRVRAQPGVMRISRSLYNQLDGDMLRLLASNRDFSESDFERLLQLDNLNKHGGATESEIGRLPLVSVTEQMLQASNDAGCSICLMGIELNSNVRLLRCFHHFHPECIDPWLKGKAECPMCKFPAIG